MSPVHDYVIANGTGSAVRSDLNNALAAIVSNNSSSSEPATKYAYQWWADTTTGQLKLRNSANNGWVTIFELDGTMLMEDGTVSAPGLAFASDLNTGFFRSAADKINFATGGVERLEIGSSEVVFNDGSNDVDFRVESNGNTHMLFVDGGNDRVGIGISSPGTPLEIAGSVSTLLRLDSSNGNGGVIRIRNGGADKHFFGSAADFMTGGTADQTAIRSNSDILFGISSNEKVRIASSGNIGIGTSSAQTKLAVQSGSLADGSILVGANYNGSGMSQNSDKLGAISFPMYASDTYPKGFRGMMSYSSSSVNFVQIGGGTTSARSATDILFYTASSISANGSEVMKIDSSGDVQIGTSAPFDGNISNRRHLTINGTSDVKLEWGIGGTERGYLYADATNLSLINTQNGYLRFNTNNTERMRIRPDGETKIYDVYTRTDAASPNMVVKSDGSLRRSTSSIKYKTNVETLEDNYADAILNVRPVWYRSLCEGNPQEHSYYGFIAEEVAEIDPRLVHFKTTEVTYDENGSTVTTPCDPEPEGVQYDRFVPHLLNLIKRQQAAIETLETKVAALEVG